MVEYRSKHIARVAELAYAYDSKSYVLTDLWVQLPPRAQKQFIVLCVGVESRSDVATNRLRPRGGVAKTASDGELLFVTNSHLGHQ